jgi:hypothetical protein
MSQNREQVKVYRYRLSQYIVNFPTPSGIQTYLFAGSKKGTTEYKMLPSEVINWLKTSSTCFENGELVVDTTDLEKSDEIFIDKTELAEYEKNSHTREDIEKILTGNVNKMKSELNKITSDSEKKFVIEVAKDLKLDSTSKRVFIAAWTDLDIDMIFTDDDTETLESTEE